MSYHLFDCVGIELEYMVVDRGSLNVRSIVDRLFSAVATDADQASTEGDDEPPSELRFGPVAWSNELARHVLEFKTAGPATNWQGLSEAFQATVERARVALAEFDATLMPSATHPWMDPEREGELWPYGQRQIYEAYDRIFDCRGHGWFNLQSMHVNLPFSGDDEFRRLHSACRLVLPLIPALSASSPFMSGSANGQLCRRLFVYAHNQIAVPAIAGSVIPDVATSIQGYHDLILAPMYSAIAPHDPDKILREEWLNSRGAIARFDRDAIELRLCDLQEAPQFDIAIAFVLTHAIRELCEERFVDLATQEAFETSLLARQLWLCAHHASRAPLASLDWARLFAGTQTLSRVADPIRELVSRALASPQLPATLAPAVRSLLATDSLAQRMLSCTPQSTTPSKADLHRVARELVEALAAGKAFVTPSPTHMGLLGLR